MLGTVRAFNVSKEKNMKVSEVNVHTLCIPMQKTNYIHLFVLKRKCSDKKQNVGVHVHKFSI